MNKKTKNIIKKALQIAIFLAMAAGIIWINALKLQDDTLSNYEKITDVETKYYYENPITPVIAALFYEDKNAGYGYNIKQNDGEKRNENIRMAVVPKEVTPSNRPVIEKLYEEMPNKNKVQELKNNGITQIFICGIETHICLLQTVQDLIKEGFEVHVVKDASSSRDKDEHKTGLELMKKYGAYITTVEIVLFELLKTSKHPNFKEIQNLIK